MPTVIEHEQFTEYFTKYEMCQLVIIKKEYSNGPLRIEYTNKTELYKTKRLTYFSINISVSSQHQFFIKTKLRAVSVKL